MLKEELKDKKEQENKHNIPLKIWDVQDSFICSIIGTCLTLDELRKIAKKMDVSISTFSDFELHQYFVEKCFNCNDFSRMVNKSLNRKFELSIKLSSHCKNEDDLIKFWKSSKSDGRLSGAYWAILTHPYSSEKLNIEIFGEVHMLSHLSVASAKKSEQKIKDLTQQLELVEKVTKDNREQFKKEIENKNREIVELIKYKNECKFLSIKLDEANRIIKKFEEGVDKESEDNIKNIKNQLELKNKMYLAIKNNYEKLIFQNKEINFKYSFLEKSYKKLENENSLLKSRIQNYNIKADCPLSVTDSKGEENCLCPNNLLSGRCLLYVGGQHSLVPHYRKIVEQYGGKFFHHDGCKEEGHNVLENLTKQSDVVLFPINCVSHEACMKIKSICKQLKKPLLPIQTSSISALSKGIEQVANLKDNF